MNKELVKTQLIAIASELRGREHRPRFDNPQPHDLAEIHAKYAADKIAAAVLELHAMKMILE